MENTVHHLGLVAILAPLLGSLIAGIVGKRMPREWSHWITIIGVAISFLSSAWLFKILMTGKTEAFNLTLYLWGSSGAFEFSVGVLIDRLAVVMMTTVTFVSMLVHVYSIGYMADDPSDYRFFSYMSLFTFGMLTLVTANNFLFLFFGWEAVGLVSYLLIGYWFKKEAAAVGSMKAFLVNRVGDFGFLLGIAAVLYYFGTLDYAQVFAHAKSVSTQSMSIVSGHEWNVITVICCLLFVGAMGKSAQIPLHVWLPESMEGPTPISALIHAATMVTAGVYMVARMSPLFNLSYTALSVVMIFGATGALFLGVLALVENNIKRVIAFSTMSQLGYMMAANGVGAYEAGIFHLVTHAFFKALLFLGAGSAIIAMHHENDMRKMGNLKQYMPITFVTYFIGTLALVALPPFSGFYSKDAIIEAVSLSVVPGAHYAYWCLLFGAFVTALYSFRSLFLVFYGKERMSDKERSHLKESPGVVTVPLVILSIPSVILGAILAGPALFHRKGLFFGAINVTGKLDVLHELKAEYHGLVSHTLHGLIGLPFWATIAGILVAWFCYIKSPEIPGQLAERFKWLKRVLEMRYGFDAFNDWVLVRGTRQLSEVLFQATDKTVIDGWMVDGSARGIARVAAVVRRVQSGYLYHYAFAMMLGLFGFLCWLLIR